MLLLTARLPDVLLVLSGFFAGAINAIAGGGSFLTFPALVFAGVPAVAANATSTLALLPGTFASVFSYRRELRPLPGIRFGTLLTVSLMGGIAGAVLLLKTPESAFGIVAPFLLLFATLIFAFGRQISTYLRSRVHIGAAAFLVMLAFIAVYGGYFGGGIGIMTLAILALYGLSNINAMNAVKTLLGGTLNAVAAAIFVGSGLIHWREAAIMALASIAGGYLGAALAQRIDQRIVRAAVVSTGSLMTLWFFLRIRH